MKKVLLITLLAISIIFPTIVYASSNYKDVVYDIVGEEEEKSKIVVYLFHQSSCPHCQKENDYFDSLEKVYDNSVVFKRYEVSTSAINDKYYKEVIERLELSINSVPFTIIGDKYFVGFSTSTKESIKKTIDSYLSELENEEIIKEEDDQNISIPILGNINTKEVSIPLIAVVLGFVDGFNPCAMWVLLFLINMLLNMKDRKKMWLLGTIFLLTSAFVYFLAMIGLSFVLGFAAVKLVRILIAFVAIIGGIVNLINYYKTPKNGCTVVDEKKRKKYFVAINKFTNEKNLFLAIIGVIVLAVSVNFVELACSAGFPTIFATILDLNNISFLESIIYILIYILFYLLDDMIVFIIAMVSLKISGITTKYNRLSHLVGGIIMIIIGLLLIIKPEWIMLNF